MNNILCSRNELFKNIRHVYKRNLLRYKTIKLTWSNKLKPKQSFINPLNSFKITKAKIVYCKLILISLENVLFIIILWFWLCDKLTSANGKKSIFKNYERVKGTRPFLVSLCHFMNNCFSICVIFTIQDNFSI